jgi:flagellar motor component MotA
LQSSSSFIIVGSSIFATVTAANTQKQKQKINKKEKCVSENNRITPMAIMIEFLYLLARQVRTFLIVTMRIVLLLVGRFAF